MWLALFANFAIVGFFLSAWANLQDWALHRSALTYSLVFGAIMAMASAAALAFSMELSPGIQYDLRATTVAVAAMLGGPLAGLIAAAVAAAIRLFIGGAGAVGGVVSIAVALSAGLVGYAMWRRAEPKLWQMGLSSFLVALAPLIGMAFLPEVIRNEVLARAGLEIFVLTFASTFIAVYVVMLNSWRAAERALLLGAIEHAPDYFYVKSRASRFVAVNRNVARLSGIDNPAHMKGMSDHDVTERERADTLFSEEQQVVTTGQPLLEKRETLAQAQGDGPLHHFVTSKQPVRLENGAIVGLVGVTRDVTTTRNAEIELAESRDQLSFILQEMSDGVALIRQNGEIVLTNERYRQMFPLTGHLRVPGGYLPTILHAAIDSGEQPDVESPEGWIKSVMDTLHQGGEEIVRLFDGRWLRIRTQVHEGGLSTIVVSDITTLKRAETELVSLTTQLELLAATDGLTKLLNRRGFDEAIEREVARARRADTPISLLMLDVDRFKAFNDKYGHVAGDDCLRVVAAVLRDAVKRPVDVVARYGGEEFAVLLPDTGLQGAYHVAEQIRTALRERNLVHGASNKGIVTASIGAGSFEGIDPALNATSLIARADEALYRAKSTGGDRTEVWTDPNLPFKSIAYV